MRITRTHALSALAMTALLTIGSAATTAAAQASSDLRTYSTPVSIRSATNASLMAEIWTASKDNGAEAALWTWYGSGSQKFAQIDRADGYVSFRAEHSDNKCLDVSGASTNDDATIVQWTCNGGGNQDWKPVRFGDGYKLVARHSGKCLDLRGAVAKSSRLVQKTCADTDSQRWYLPVESL